MATWTQLDNAIGRLKIQLVLTEQDPERATHWYGRAVREISWLTDDLQRANQQARDPGELDAIAVVVPDTWCWCFATPEPAGPWVYPSDEHADVCGSGPRRAGERPYQPTGRPTGHGEPASETTDPAQPSTLPAVADNGSNP